MNDRPRRILVLQTTRMGDMLQTSPLLRFLRRRRPAAHIAVMLRRMGRAVAERIPGIDEIIVYDEDQMFLNLRAHDSDKFLQAYDRAVYYVEQIKSGQFDVAYNCAQSIGSAMLLKLAEVPAVIGAHFSTDWQFVLRGRWTNFLFTSIRHRTFSDLNLCDVFRNLVFDEAETPPAEETETIDRLCLDVTEADRRAAREILEPMGVRDSDMLVCLQLGASEHRKRWPEYRFAALARLIRDRYNATIVLIGVKEETKLGEEFAQHHPGPALSLFGRTSIPQLAAILERAAVLVSNDTGTMHIAAAVNCPVVLVSVGPVHFRETGPYGDGHCAVERADAGGEARESDGRECDSPETRGAILPEQVMCAVETVLTPQKQRTQIADTERLRNVVLYRSAFAPDGCLEWYPVIRRPFSESDLLRIAYRAMWLDFLRGEKAHPEWRSKRETESIARMLECFSPVDSSVLGEWVARYVAPFRELDGWAEQGVQIAEDLIRLLQAGATAESQERVSVLMRLDERMRLHGEIHPWLRPLTVAAAHERDNLEGSNPVSLAQTTRQIYQDLAVRARLMQAKLQHIAEVLRTL